MLLDFRRIIGIIAAVTTEFLHGSLNEALEDLVARPGAMAPTSWLIIMSATLIVADWIACIGVIP